MADRSSISNTANDLFDRLYNEKSISPTNKRTGKKKQFTNFKSAWNSGKNPIRRMGQESAQMMSDFNADLSVDREAYEGMQTLDFESYFSSLDGIQGDLKTAAGLLSNGTGSPIKDRAALRSARTKAIQERQQAKKLLERSDLQYMDESSTYKDPMTGEVVTMTESGMGAAAYQRTSEGIYDEALSSYRTKFSALAEAQGISQWALYKRTHGISDDSQSAGNEQMIMDQTAAGFASLASSSAQGRMASYQTELQLRTETAEAELDSRKKANRSVTQMEKDKLRQAKQIDNSITDINKMFSQADHDFRLAADAQVNQGVDFRTDRPT
tara:strand:- start:2195 stop:3172 length:978 start_codon:yes stop_codon:yes gene_type:complete